MKKIDLNDLALFVEVVNAGSFSEAARRLSMPKATISRHISLLEQSLGVKLIQRNTHQFSVSNLGQQYYKYCLDVVDSAERANCFINKNNGLLQGTIKFSCPIELLDLYIGKMVLTFMQHYPHIQVQIDNTNRIVDIIQERFDFALRVRPMPLADNNLIARPLFHTQYYLVASPTLLAEPIHAFSQLANYPCLNWGDIQDEWLFYQQDGHQYSVPFSARLTIENLYLLREAAVNGLGIAALLEVMIRDELARDDLHIIQPKQWNMQPWLVHAAYLSRGGTMPTVELFLNFLSEQFSLLAKQFPETKQTDTISP